MTQTDRPRTRVRTTPKGALAAFVGDDEPTEDELRAVDDVVAEIVAREVDPPRE